MAALSCGDERGKEGKKETRREKKGGKKERGSREEPPFPCTREFNRG